MALKVKEIKKVAGLNNKNFPGIFDYEILFEPNHFKVKSEIFSSSVKTEFLTAKAYEIEKTKNAQIELKREIVS